MLMQYPWRILLTILFLNSIILCQLHASETKIVKLLILDKSSSSEEIQKLVFSIGKENNFENLRDWFKSLYEILLGQSEGPRMGSFISLYGIKETKNLIDDALLGKLK